MTLSEIMVAVMPTKLLHVPVERSDSTRISDYSYCYQKVSAASSCNWYASAGNSGLVTHIQNNIAKMDISLGYDSQNRLTGPWWVGWRTTDPNAGNTTWDDMGRSTGVSKGSTTGTIAYGGLGQDELLQQKSGSSTEAFVYGRDSQAGIPTEEQVTATGDANPTIVNNDSFGKPLDFVEGSASQFIMYDGTGNMIGTIDNTGANTSTYHLDPYGALLSITSGATTAASQPKAGTASAATMADASKQLKASGATATAAAAASAATSSGGGEAGWATFGVEGSVTQYWKRGARWNDTYTGTWTSVDPITRLNDSSRANPYAYAGDNPLNATDPSGRSWFDSQKDSAVTWSVSFACDATVAAASDGALSVPGAAWCGAAGAAADAAVDNLG